MAAVRGACMLAVGRPRTLHLNSGKLGGYRRLRDAPARLDVVQVQTNGVFGVLQRLFHCISLSDTARKGWHSCCVASLFGVGDQYNGIAFHLSVILEAAGCSPRETGSLSDSSPPVLHRSVELFDLDITTNAIRPATPL